MLRPPLLAEYCQPGVYTFTPIKGLPGTGILSSPPSLPASIPSPQPPNLTPIRPAPPTDLSPLLTPVVFTPASIESPCTGRKSKPATVREMLKSKKQMQMERQALQAAYQIVQVPRTQAAVVHIGTTGQGIEETKNLVGRKKGGSSTKAAISEDKKAMHRVNERNRHQNMNQALRELVSVLPKNPAPESETKQFVLQKAHDYIAYLKGNIQNVCDDMGVVAEQQEGGLMSFDIPFEQNTGGEIVKVPPSKPITHTDLKSLLGPTSELKLSEPPKRKPLKPVVKKIKPKPVQQHQPWLEINIKMNVSPHKKKSSRRAPSTATRPKASSKKTSTAKKKVTKRKTAGRTQTRGQTANYDIKDDPSTFQNPGIDQSWISIGLSQSGVDSSSQSSMNTTSSSGVSHSQSSIVTSEGIVLTDFNSQDDEIDLTCLDVLSPDEDDSPQGPSSEVNTYREFLLPLFDSPPNIPNTPACDDSASPPWIRYGSLMSAPDASLCENQLQNDHSYSARALSPEILQTISSSQFQNLHETLPSHLDFDFGGDVTADLTDSVKLKSTKKKQTSPRYEEPPPDAVLQAAVLMEPPPDCVPPMSPRSEGSTLAIQAFGLDFDEDSNSSLGSFSQSSSPALQMTEGSMGAENLDAVMASFAQQNSSLRRSWINGYQLFTKINHQRIKGSWPGLQGREITRLLGQSWKDLPDEFKKLYSTRACEWNKWYREMRNVAKTSDC